MSGYEVARYLGGLSPAAVKNWLEGGHFPGAFRDHDGRWLFPRDEVLAVRRRMDDLAEKNRRGDMTPADMDGGFDPPAL